ncbi:MAG: XRE family transcriptional regulator [Acidithiobacillus ferriphilus]
MVTMNYVPVRPELLRWARERAGLPLDSLITRFRKLNDWEMGRSEPTFKQLEAYAKTTRVPFGYFFLSEPPEEPLPIPDFRTIADTPLQHPTPDLLDTIYAMQRRQAWLREERIEQGADPLAFVGSVAMENTPLTVATEMRRILGIGTDWAREHNTWTDALRALRVGLEELGVVVVINGVVGNNTHRKLDPMEFRGFVLADHYAPLIFLNGSDGKAAQMFTLAHELAHLWVGQDAVFNLLDLEPADVNVERFCNRVAAEFLIPENEMRTAWTEALSTNAPYQAIARRFKVSELVAARRALDLAMIQQGAFTDFYNRYLDRERNISTGSEGGGDFYATQGVRVGRVFAEAVNHAVREGRLLYREAFELTGLYGTTFDKYVSKAGIRGD